MTKAKELCDTIYVVLGSKEDGVDTTEAEEKFRKALEALTKKE